MSKVIAMIAAIAMMAVSTTVNATTYSGSYTVQNDIAYAVNSLSRTLWVNPNPYNATTWGSYPIKSASTTVKYDVIIYVWAISGFVPMGVALTPYTAGTIFMASNGTILASELHMIGGAHPIQ